MKQRQVKRDKRQNGGVTQRAAGFVRTHKNLVATVGSLLFVVLVWQLTYPSGKALPFAQLDGSKIGGQTAEQMSAAVAKQYADVPIKLTYREKEYSGKASQGGITPNVERTVADATAYPWWQRLIPLTLPLLGLTQDHPVVPQAEGQTFDEFAATQAKLCAVPAKNAGVKVEDNKATLDPAKPGASCTTEMIQTAILATPLKRDGTVVSVTPESLTPERTDEQVQAELEQAQAILDRDLTLKLLSGSTKQVEKSTIASWIVFPEDEKTRQLSTDIDAKKVLEYLEKEDIASYEKGARSNPTVDRGETATAIRTQLLQQGGEVRAVRLTAGNDQTYSPTRSGLQVLLYDLQRDKGDYAIAVRTAADDVNISVSGSSHYHPASTYKMFVGWAIIKKIEAGQLKWTDQAVGGKTVSQCFDTMIIDSDNDCAEWLGKNIGWTKLNGMLKDIGFTCTNLSSAWYSCANDETLFLHKLQTGQLLPANQADRLLSIMKKQRFREGIPAGVDAAVADKVGFLDGMLHDAGIVYAKHGTYSLTILTDGSSWAQIADATRQIDAQLARM